MKVQATEKFTLKDFDKIKDSLVRENKENDEYGQIYKGDIFVCDKEMFDYLNGTNKYNKSFVKMVVEYTKDEETKEIPEVELNEFGNPVGTRELKEEVKFKKNKKTKK